MTKRYKTTIKDVAREAGVSETTVSLSFKPESRISIKTREKILKIAQKMNYVPNSMAKNLRNGRTKTLGLIVNDITASFYTVMSRTAKNVAYNYGYQLLYTENSWSPEQAIESTRSLLTQQVEGLILCLCEKEQQSLEMIESLKIPHIVVDTAPDFYRGPYVINNEYSIGKMVGKHLIKQGCKNIAYFNGSKEMASFSSFKQQLAGLKDVIESHKLGFSAKDIFYAGFSIQDGAEAFNKLVASGKKYDGIMCINDEVAYGVMEEAERCGLRVGTDIAIVGVDNIKTSSLDRISLTSININYELMTTLAVNTLIDGIEKGHKITSRIVLEPEIILRNSSKFQCQ